MILYKLKNRKGFTLIELVIVLVISAILLTLGSLSLAGYVRVAKFKQNTEYAKTLYLAAQTSLTDMKATGLLAEYASSVENDSSSKTLDEVTISETSVDPTLLSSFSSRIFTIRQADGGNNPQIRALLDNYIYDHSLLDVAIAIELDPIDGTVYSVFYSDKATAFYYNGEFVAAGAKSITSREYDDLRRDLTGYYGSSNVSDAAPVQLGRPVVETPKLYNDESLYLQWNLSRKWRASSGLLTYTIEVYGEKSDGTGDELLFTIKLNDGEAAHHINSVSGNAYITTKLRVGDSQTETEFIFKAYATSDSSAMRLYFDMLDLDALETSNEAILNGSYSFARIINKLQVDPDKIYMRIQASGDSYKSSVWKQSNSESPLYGGVERENSTSVEYKLKNFRHLNNLRFYTDAFFYLNSHSYTQSDALDTSSVTTTFNQTSDMTWLGNGGIISNGNVYRSMASVTDSDNTPFNEFTSLPAGISLTTTNKSKLTKLLIEDNTNNASNTALFAENSGTISELIFVDTAISATGADALNTAIVCGINNGDISNVTAGGTVEGKNNVGGICGLNEKNITGSYSTAKLTGEKFLGGIAGRNSASGDAATGIINCGASFDYTNNEIDALVSRGLVSKGECVGGIVGLNESSAKLSACYTGNGFVYGEKYVGGIVGFQAYETGVASALSGDPAKSSKLNVIAESYAGGIVGTIGTVANDGTYAVVAANTPQAEIKLTISDWVNSGIVAVTSEYGGGIIGANYGTIVHCRSEIDTSTSSGTALLNSAEKWGKDGSYVGGIAGYNKGVIRANEGQKVKIVSVVSGKNYIGGIVGYNAENAIIEDYELTSCSVSGECYVGGVVGLNLSKELFSYELKIKLNTIKGKYFAGGIIGANIVEGSEALSLNAKMNIDSFLGSVSADGAFAGGFIGFNSLVIDSESALTVLNQSLYTDTGDNQILKGYEGSTFSFKAEAIEAILDATRASEFNENTEATLTINGGSEGGTAITATSNLASVSGGVFVGGVIGFNSQNTVLLLENIENNTRIVANEALTFSEFMGESADPILATIDEAYKDYFNGSEVKFALSGGIVGCNSLNTTITNCTNGGNAEVAAQKATYHGGLCELNFGIIENCEAISFGTNNIDYVGGLVGINYQAEVGKGLIKNCTFENENVVIAGKNNVGGLVSINLGGITWERTGNPLAPAYELSARIVGRGDNIGGVAGISAPINVGSNSTDSIEKANVINTDVISTGSNVGGVVGCLYGTIKECLVVKDSTGSVTGLNAVGGVIGSVAGSSADDYVSTDLVSAVKVVADGYNAGGIVGSLDFTSTEGSNSIYTLDSCDNSGEVVARSGNSGGITAYVSNSVHIVACSNTQSVSANAGAGDGSMLFKGLAGGITSVNEGTILNCTVGSAGSNLTVTGMEYIGAIAAQNKGKIISSTVTGATVNDVLGKTTVCKLGGIAGINEPNAEIIGCSVEDSTAVSYINGSAVGGAVGINNGSLRGNITDDDASAYEVAAISTSSVDVDVHYNSSTDEGYLGGIAGENHNTIAYYNYSGDLEANSGNEYGYGGIAGINTVKIENCIFSGTLTAAGDISDKVNAGGIAGMNNIGAVVEHCSVHSASAVSLTVDAGYVGGIVGYNHGRVEFCGIEYAYNNLEDEINNADADEKIETDADETEYAITVDYGDIGGIVGYNYYEGTVQSCITGVNWTVRANAHQTDTTASGIIGYNLGVGVYKNLINHATVTKNAAGSNSVAGIMGRSENAEVSEWGIEDSINYGNIVGIERVGGFIGQLKYKGGTFKNCRNYGDIGQSNCFYSGGLIGYTFRTVSNVTFTFDGCINGGTISGSDGNGGIVGNLSRDNNNSSVKCYMIDCANYGKISSSGKSAGILAASNANETRIYRCRNYGTGTSDSFYGITSVDSINVCHYCFGISPINATQRLAPKANSTNYWIADDNTNSQTDGIDINNCTALSTAANSGGNTFVVANLFDGYIEGGDGETAGDEVNDRWGTTQLANDSSNRLFNNDNFSTSLSFKFSKDYSFSKIKIAFYGTSRTYYCAFNSTEKDDYDEVSITTDRRIKVFNSSITTNNQELTLNIRSTYKFISIYEIEFFDEYGNKIPKYQPPVSGTATDVATGATQLILTPSAIEGSFTANYQDTVIIDTFIKNPLSLPIYANTIATKEVYDDIDDKINTYLTDTAFGTASGASDANISYKNGVYNITWAAVNNNTGKPTNYKYSVDVDIMDGSTVVGTYNPDAFDVFAVTSATWVPDPALVEECYLKGYTLRVTVTAKNAENEASDVTATSSQTTYLLKPLATPEYHIELIKPSDENGNTNYRYVLHNPEDYYVNEAWIISKVNLCGQVFIPTGEPAAGESLYWYTNEISSSSSTSTVRAWVNAINNSTDYGDSVIVTADTKLFDPVLLSTKTATDKGESEHYLTGVSEVDLAVITRIAPANKIEIFYRSDLVISDSTLGDVVYSYQVYRLPGQTSTATFDIRLVVPDSSLLLNNVKVNSYIYKTQNDIEFFGYYIEKGLTEDELRAKDYLFPSGTRSDDEGYIIEYAGTNADGEAIYNIYFSTVKSLELSEQLFEHSIDIPDGQEYPVVTFDESNYTVSWDADMGNAGDYENAAYSVSIIGTTPDEKVVQLYANANDTGRSFTADASSFNYYKLDVSVTRLGVADTDGRTTKRCSTTEESFNVKLKLDSITRPSLELTPKNDRLSSKDELYYEITWVGISTASQLEHIASYTVYGELVGNEAVNLGSVLLSETPDGSATYSINYDFGNYLPGDIINVYVVANAKPDSEKFTDSLPGTPYVLTIPARLTQPDESNNYQFLVDPAYGEGGVSLYDFENGGVDIRIINHDTTETGRYVLEAIISKNSSLTVDFDAEGFNGSDYEYYTDRVSMDGNLNSAYYTLDELRSEWAGHYVYVRVRATSDDSISSLWSDVVKIRLPRIRLDSPSFEVGVRDVEYTYTEINADNTSTVSAQVTLSDTTVKINTVDYAESYEITVTRIDGSSFSFVVGYDPETDMITSVSRDGTSLQAALDGSYIVDSFEYGKLTDNNTLYIIPDFRYSISADGDSLLLTLPDTVITVGSTSTLHAYTSEINVVAHPISASESYVRSDATVVDYASLIAVRSYDSISDRPNLKRVITEYSSETSSVSFVNDIPEYERNYIDNFTVFAVTDIELIANKNYWSPIGTLTITPETDWTQESLSINLSSSGGYTSGDTIYIFVVACAKSTNSAEPGQYENVFQDSLPSNVLVVTIP